DDKIKKKIRIIQFQYLWPFAKEFTIKVLQSSKDILLIENNSNGQLGNLIAQETGIVIKNRLLKYDGRPFYREELTKVLKKF
ncbi:2-oxoacid:acceptor oxidoreductase subunit alpha, partial [bacterium]|nr:2-oxoacid:acceptor oxidoreductase subunit alpha [bacterium]